MNGRREHERCGTCAFHFHEQDCKRRAPVLDGPDTKFPSTLTWNWCADYESREPPEHLEAARDAVDLFEDCVKGFEGPRPPDLPLGATHDDTGKPLPKEWIIRGVEQLTAEECLQADQRVGWLRDVIVIAHSQLQQGYSELAMHTLARTRRKFAEVEPGAEVVQAQRDDAAAFVKTTRTEKLRQLLDHHQVADLEEEADKGDPHARAELRRRGLRRLDEFDPGPANPLQAVCAVVDVTVRGAWIMVGQAWRAAREFYHAVQGCR